MHINWSQNQICVLGCTLRSHSRNGNEFQTPWRRWLPAKHWDTWFLILVNPKLVWNSWNLACYHGAASTCHGTNFVPFVAGWVYASHKPELLTTSMMVFGRERPTFGDGTISIASYCFQFFFSCQHRTTGVSCEFCDFPGFVWTFLCINWVFNAFMCIIQIWTTCACSNAYKFIEKSNMCPWVHA